MRRRSMIGVKGNRRPPAQVTAEVTAQVTVNERFQGVDQDHRRNAAPALALRMEPSANRDVAHSPSNPQGAPDQVFIAVVSQFIRELHPRNAGARAVVLSSRLEQDLGVDSLARTELILRIERAFRLRLPIHVAAEAETVEDLFRALGRLRISRAGRPRRRACAILRPASVSAPQEAKTLVEVARMACGAASRPAASDACCRTRRRRSARLTYGELAATAQRRGARLDRRRHRSPAIASR